MEFLGAAVSSVASILFLTMVVAGVYKLFQMATLLSEAKDLLLDIKRNTSDHLPAVPPPTATFSPGATHASTAGMSLESAENLLRAVAELDHPVPPAVVELERKS